VEFVDLQAALAEQIRSERQRVGLSQEALALAAEVDRTYVSQLERGIANPSLQILHRLATALDAELVVSISGKD
jgi:transcriptional regulator with XRE-family HTH domain